MRKKGVISGKEESIVMEKEDVKTGKIILYELGTLNIRFWRRYILEVINFGDMFWS